MSLQRNEDAHEELLQERLRILLDRLRWSYINLWTLNPQTRVLEWRRGHCEVANAKAGAREYARLFYTAHKSCCFTPGVGAVGRAHLDGKHIWLTGDTICQHAGSIEQSQFLRCAEIKTTMCIPWVDSVLEIGTISVVAENLVLTDRIQQVLANDLLSVPVPLPTAPELAGFEHASTRIGRGATVDVTMFPGFHQDSAPRVDHPTNLGLQPPSCIRQRSSSGIPLGGSSAGHLSLAEQAWRPANKLSLRLSSDNPESHPNSLTDMVKENLTFGQEAGASSSSSMHMQARGNAGAPATGRSEMINQAVNHSRGLMSDQYKAMWSDAAVASSSTVSSHEGSSARASVSPELQQHVLAHSSANPRFSADDRASTSGTLHSQLPGPRNLNQIRRTNSCGDQHEIQKYHTLYEAQEMHDHWRQQLKPEYELATNPDATVVKTLASEPLNLPAAPSFSYQGWKRDVGSPAPATLQIVNPNDPSRKPTVQRSNVKLMNQVSKIAGPLLRGQSLSALELLKDVDKYQQEAAEIFHVPYDVKPVQVLQAPRGPAHVQINRPNPRGQRRTMGGVELASSSGPVHAGHDEAAANHMLAERRRRTKQKENFTALRRLVPIISKADKASTLIDTITYLTFLQKKIKEIEASRDSIDHRCEILENRCKGLRDRNQELVEMISKDQPPGSAIHLNLVHLKLQSMGSI